jgi:hypothetical protein
MCSFTSSKARMIECKHACAGITKANRKVSFDLSKNNTFETFSKDEYDRHQIESTLLKKCYNRLTQVEWKTIFQQLNKFKCEEMLVHKDSIDNLNIHQL